MGGPAIMTHVPPALPKGRMVLRRVVEEKTASGPRSERVTGRLAHANDTRPTNLAFEFYVTEVGNKEA